MSLVGHILAGQFQVVKKVGSGSFGEVYEGRDVQTGHAVAIKTEKRSAKPQMLMFEGQVLQHLLRYGVNGIPDVRWLAQEGTVNVMIMTLLGPSLEDLLKYCNGAFSVKTVLMIADQILSRFEKVHQADVLHRDVKPENFLLGLGNSGHIVHLIDFGLSKRYRNPNQGSHIPFLSGKSLTGTARYASINALRGYEQSRRDDLESLGYLFVYLLKGQLPWQGLPARTKNEKYKKILEKKVMVPLDMLCAGLPTEFATFLYYARNLNFEDSPDYQFLKRLFRGLYYQLGFATDGLFDWTLRSVAAENQQVPRPPVPTHAVHPHGGRGYAQQ